MRQNLYLALTLSLLSWGCTKSTVDDGDIPSIEDQGDGQTQEVTKWMDDILSVYYLYNDEYNAMTRDLTLSYSEFLGATLTQMTTNVLDYKQKSGSSSWSLYSSIYRTASTKSETTKVSMSKELELSYGLAAVTTVVYSPDNAPLAYGIGVLAVIADSPLYDAGVRRGDIIWAVNGSELTSVTAYNYASTLLNPSSPSTLQLSLDSGDVVTITSKYMYCSPILQTDVYNGSVGYLSYLSFDIAYDTDLLSALTELKSAGVSDLILDLRLNTGGYNVSANKLATSIMGDDSSERVFMRYEYNPTRMAKLSDSYTTEYFTTGLQESHLNLDRLYCLVGEYTASASELVINSLRGVGVEVILIGEQTVGKNVGMEIFDDSFDGWEYEFYPITFASYNEAGEGDYSDGFMPDYEVDDWFYGINFSDFNEEEVMIKKALDLISGADDDSSSTKSTIDEAKVKGNRGELYLRSAQKGGNIVTR